MNLLRKLSTPFKIFLCALVGIFQVACSAASQQAFLNDAPAIIAGTLATGNELAAAYAAAQQSVGSGKLNVASGLAAANAALGSANANNLQSTLASVFGAVNQLGTDLKTANPSATTAQVAAAQSSAITAAQVALQVAAPAGSVPATTAVLRLHYDHGKLYVTNERPLSSSKQLTSSASPVSPADIEQEKALIAAAPYRMRADLRPVFGWRDAYSVTLARN